MSRQQKLKFCKCTTNKLVNWLCSLWSSNYIQNISFKISNVSTHKQTKACVDRFSSLVIRQKDASQNRCFKKTKQAKFSEKRLFLTPWYAYARLSENLAALFSWNTRFEIRPFAPLPTSYVSKSETLGIKWHMPIYFLKTFLLHLAEVCCALHKFVEPCRNFLIFVTIKCLFTPTTF